MNKSSRIFVAGHRGLVGAAIVRHLLAHEYRNLLLRERKELDLTDQAMVKRFFAEEKPEYVFLAAAKVGGIYANNTYSGDFIRENLQIEVNVIDAAYRHGVRKLQFLGSSCIYPRLAPQPMSEDSLLTGPLEPTNEWYAIAKIAGLKMCQAYRKQYGFNAISLMPTNLYGPGDNFDLQNSHVLPALIRKFDDAKRNGAKEVDVWGTGTPRREFLQVDDLADACLYLMQSYDGDIPLNIGWGEDIAIAELAQIVRQVVGFAGQLRFDPSKPDGAPRKVLDTTLLSAAGWEPKIKLEEGIRATYEWYLTNRSNLRAI